MLKTLSPAERIAGRFIPQGSVKVSDKKSDAVAYAYTNRQGRPAAIAYYGTALKPAWHFNFANEAARERRVTELFKSRQYQAERKAERKAEAAKPHKLEAGHILVSSWGYDQTNIDFYQVTKVISEQMVEIRPIASTTTEETGWAQGKCVPLIDHFKGEPMRKRVSGADTVKIASYAYAHLWDGRPRNWTAYA